MPTPATAKWPKPRSEDEFEDIVVDFLRIRWKDPNAARNGRRGQRQGGVDVVGRPPWLKGKLAGGQCKNTDSLTLAAIVAEAEKAKSFKAELSEFLVVTSADRDSALQAAVRAHFLEHPVPFHVDVVFWPDVVADLSGDDTLVAKHWKGFAQSAAPSRGAPHPRRWIDRQGVRDDEKAEFQVQTAISVPGGADVDDGEMAAALLQLARSEKCGLVVKTLLEQPVEYDGQRRRWCYRYRRYQNVLESWQLEVSHGGELAFTFAEFRSGDIRLFNVVHLIDAVILPLNLQRAMLEVATAATRSAAPSKAHVQVFGHGTGPMILHDEIGLTAASLFATHEAPADWSVDLVVDWDEESVYFQERLLNRIVSKFIHSEGGSSIPSVRLDAMLKLLGCEISNNPLDLLGAKDPPRRK